MHEWALAEAVISSVVKTAEGEGLGKITKIKVNI
jgi:Zn finger protein HypA/HybF involved in hydrogenase expression